MRQPARGAVRIYDNGGETLDRFTCYFTRPNSNARGDKWFDYLAMSANPFHPQGFGQHGEVTSLPPADCPEIGKRIKFTDCPPDVQRCILQDLDDTQLTERS